MDQPAASNHDLTKVKAGAAPQSDIKNSAKAVKETAVAQAPEVKPDEQPEKSVHIPVMQRILDNPFLLLFIGVTFPAVFYLMWGLIELTQMPNAK